MTDFLGTLKSRREAARLRLEVARKSVASAEAELRKWSDAVDLEEGRGEEGREAANGSHQATKELRSLTLDSVRRKEDILRAALRAAQKPLKPSDMLEMVKPAMSRATIYLLVKRMKATGELNEFSGKFSLVGSNGNGNGHHAPSVSAGSTLALPLEAPLAPNFNHFVDAVSSRGKVFLLELKDRTSGIDSYDLAKLLGYQDPRQIGGLTGGGLAKAAKKNGVNLKLVYRKKVTFPEGKRTVMFYPGKLLLELPREEKPAL